jgi:ankyrin repeat protein
VIRKLLEIYPPALNEKSDSGWYLNEFSKGGVIEYLLDVDPMLLQQQNGKDGSTALQHICRSNFRLERMEYLVRYPGIRINVRNYDGMTTLHRACQEYGYHVIKLLLQHPDIDVNTRDNEFEMPLHKIFERTPFPVEAVLRIVELLINHPTSSVNLTKNEIEMLMGNVPIKIVENQQCDKYERNINNNWQKITELLTSTPTNY